jgi:hypothetical protein
LPPGATAQPAWRRTDDAWKLPPALIENAEEKGKESHRPEFRQISNKRKKIICFNVFHLHPSVHYLHYLHYLIKG